MILLVVLILTVEEVKITIHKVVQILLKITLIRVQVIYVKVITDKAILIQTQIQAVMARIQIIIGQMVAITIIISHKHDMLVGYQLTE
ncbi:hypothetical protein CRM88_02055 [Lactococcus lactis]|nr:hypothetical protein B8W94_13135 [Lactococcus lactis]PEN19556.1 hypothetical protein CRM88_02055 [Lactococcus lactis]